MKKLTRSFGLSLLRDGVHELNSLYHLFIYLWLAAANPFILCVLILKALSGDKNKR